MEEELEDNKPSNVIEGPWSKDHSENTEVAITTPEIGSEKLAEVIPIAGSEEINDQQTEEETNVIQGPWEKPQAEVAEEPELELEPESEGEGSEKESKGFRFVERYTNFKKCEACGGRGRKWFLKCPVCRGLGGVPENVSTKRGYLRS